MKDINLKSMFKMQPEKAIEYLESKGEKITFDWREMWEDAHAKAFTVAKMTQADLLSDTHKVLINTIKNGDTPQKTEKELTEMFKKRGWWGKQIVKDKDGNEKEVQLGSARRVRTIYRQNIQSAYMAGKYVELIEDADIAPFWQYECILDGKTRPEHEAMHGKIFKYNDPIWNAIYPPNGWGCRCTVKNLSGYELDKNNLKVLNSGKNFKMKDTVINAKTGDTRPVAEYTFNHNGKKITFSPDAGWSANVGKASYLDDVLAKKLEDVPEEIRTHFVKEIAVRQGKKAKDIEKLYTKTIPKQKAKELGLTAQHFKDIQDYTTSSFSINKALGALKTKPNTVSAEIKDKINSITEAISTQVLPEPIIVYRGSNFDIFQNKIYYNELIGLLKNPKNGDKIRKLLILNSIRQNRFMSTSTSIDKATEYAKGNKEPRILWTLNLPKGTKAIKTHDISTKKYEKEILLQRDSNLEIKRIKHKNGIWHIEADIESTI